MFTAYASDTLPADAAYLRVTLLETGGQFWTPQISSVTLLVAQ